MVGAMCGVQMKGRKSVKDLMLTTNQLAMSNSVLWHGHVLRREDGHVLREVDGQRKKARPKRTLIRHVEEESVKVGLIREDHFANQSEVSA